MEFSLDRFRSAHEGSYETALQEIKAGRKQSHWMWYIFPQIHGLGHSTMAMYYEIQSKTEAVEYWNDPVLRSHMEEICKELLKLEGSIDWIMGYPDNLKLRSILHTHCFLFSASRNFHLEKAEPSPFSKAWSSCCPSDIKHSFL